MPIAVTCGSCRKQFNVPDHYAGKTGKCTQCGSPIVAPAANSARAADGKLASDEQLVAFAAGSTLAGYKLQKKLGGEKSSVFLAQGPKGPVAVKVLPGALSEKSAVAAKRFLREARSLFGIEHPNVVTCLDAGEELGTLYLVMELFSGRTVKDLMAERGGKIPEAEALAIALQVAHGLEHFHSQKLVHRNVMPEHILVGADGTAKLVGLGLVKSEDQEQAVTMKGVAVGTPQYMSPEQARGEQELDVRTDLFSLGVTLYEMLAGAVPWFHKAPLRVLQMVEKEPPPPLREKNPAVSAGAVEIVERLLRKDKAARYQTPLELARDLEAVQRGGSPAPPGSLAASPATSGARSPRTPNAPASTDTDALVRKLLYAVFGLGAIVLVLLAVVVALLVKR